MHIEHNIACNTSENPGATDRAMTDLLEIAKTDAEALKKRHLPEHKIRFPFSSKRKRMSTLIENVETSNDYGKRLHVKGASEIVKGCCSHYLDADGNVKELTDDINSELDDKIDEFARNALRTIALAYKDVLPGECGPEHDEPKNEEIKNIEKSGLTLICIFGIQDVIRDEVPGAVAQIHRAGVTVRMVTGDNLTTAKAIAVECNLIKDEDKDKVDYCMEGPEFYRVMGGLIKVDGKEAVKNFEEFSRVMKKLKVMARSRPEDKYLMVTGLRQMGHTVAVTGDGTNDAPALKKADVGFAMGKSGTDTCKEAADILITDDNFKSIVKACMWGRNVFDNIKRFLQFQLTVNVAACIIAFIGSVIGKESPLQPIQLLWVNLIMDSLASLALATEPPKESLLLRKPQNRSDYVVSRRMIKHVLGQSIWQCVVLFTFLFAGEYMVPENIEKYEFKSNPGFVYPGRAADWDGSELYGREMTEKLGPSRHLTFIFTAFVLMQIFNMICARKINDEWNIFEGIFRNIVFLIIWVIIIGGQVLITTFGSLVFVVSPDGLSGAQWGLAFAVGATSFVINFLLKLWPDQCCFQIGNDSVHDRRMQEKKDKQEARRLGMSYDAFMKEKEAKEME
jgi:Ca2+ transporting ATPase